MQQVFSGQALSSNSCIWFQKKRFLNYRRLQKRPPNAQFVPIRADCALSFYHVRSTTRRTQCDRKRAGRLTICVQWHRIRALNSAERSLVPLLVAARTLDRCRQQRTGRRRHMYRYHGLQPRGFAPPSDVRTHAPLHLLSVSRRCCCTTRAAAGATLGQSVAAGARAATRLTLQSREPGTTFLIKLGLRLRVGLGLGFRLGIRLSLGLGVRLFLRLGFGFLLLFRGFRCVSFLLFSLLRLLLLKLLLSELLLLIGLFLLFLSRFLRRYSSLLRGLLCRELLLTLGLGFLIGQLLRTLLFSELRGARRRLLLFTLLFLQGDVSVLILGRRRRGLHLDRRGGRRNRAGCRRRQVRDLSPQLCLGARRGVVLPVDAVVQEDAKQHVHQRGERERLPCPAFTRRTGGARAGPRARMPAGLPIHHCDLTNNPTRLTPRAFISDITFMTTSYCTVLLPSALIFTTTGGVCSCGAALPTVGRLMMEGETSGAVTMKMTSNTSITSMYGTTLMSDMARRELPRMLERIGPPAILNSLVSLTLQDVRELFDKRFEADREAVDIVCVAVIRHHRRNRGEQADCRGHKRFGNTRRHVRKRCLLYVSEAAERIHDPQDCAEQTDIRTDRTHRREKREVHFEHIHFTLERSAHRAAGTVENGRRIVHAAFFAFQELTHARFENPFQRTNCVAVVGSALIKRLQVAARPEIAFEALGLIPCTPNGKPLADDVSPRQQRQQQQQRHDGLRQQAGMDDERNDRQVLCSVHKSPLLRPKGASEVH